jgi:hypothetical protein
MSVCGYCGLGNGSGYGCFLCRLTPHLQTRGRFGPHSLKTITVLVLHRLPQMGSQTVDWNSSCAHCSSARAGLGWCCPRQESTRMARGMVPACPDNRPRSSTEHHRRRTPDRLAEAYLPGPIYGLTPFFSVIDCPRILSAHLPSHVPRLLLSFLRGQQNNTISLTGPFTCKLRTGLRKKNAPLHI